jgi:hypothetical protein
MELPCLIPENPLQYSSKEGCDPVLLNRPAGLKRPSSDRRVSFAAAADCLTVYRKNEEIGRKNPMGGGKVKEAGLSNQEELILKVTKEIMVKFIEIGRISTTNFEDTFKMVNDTVRQSLK